MSKRIFRKVVVTSQSICYFENDEFVYAEYDKVRENNKEDINEWVSGGKVIIIEKFKRLQKELEKLGISKEKANQIIREILS